MYEAIGRPLELGGLRLKNRIVFAPTTLGLAEPQQEQLLRRIAAGGCALIILGDVPVGRGGFGLSLYTRKGFKRYQHLAQVVHGEGCLIGAQLHQSDSDLKAMLKYLPGFLTKRISADQLRSLLNQQAAPTSPACPPKR